MPWDSFRTIPGRLRGGLGPLGFLSRSEIDHEGANKTQKTTGNPQTHPNGSESRPWAAGYAASKVQSDMIWVHQFLQVKSEPILGHMAGQSMQNKENAASIRRRGGCKEERNAQVLDLQNGWDVFCQTYLLKGWAIKY